MRAAVGCGRGQRGYVLVFVLGALALIAFVAARFAGRIESLRAQTATLQAHAQWRLQAANALAATLYTMSTATLPGPGGLVRAGVTALAADDRPYRLPGEAEVRIQDARGLIGLNTVQREPLAHLLGALGVPRQDTDRLYDVLQDYIDTDNLKRLNGAEAPEYAALHLPPPRNDWLVSPLELMRMPGWRDRPEVAERVAGLSTTARDGVINPNTASPEVLRAMLPGARPDQIDRLVALRRTQPFDSAAQAGAATGLALDSDVILFHAGLQYRVTVSMRGAARALQYNLRLLPAGPKAPWLVSEVHEVPRIGRSEDTEDASPFPLALGPGPEPRSLSTPEHGRRVEPEW
jgi:general secretion pathway protein K